MSKCAYCFSELTAVGCSNPDCVNRQYDLRRHESGVDFDWRVLQVMDLRDLIETMPPGDPLAKAFTPTQCSNVLQNLIRRVLTLEERIEQLEARQ